METFILYDAGIFSGQVGYVATTFFVSVFSGQAFFCLSIFNVISCSYYLLVLV